MVPDLFLQGLAIDGQLILRTRLRRFDPNKKERRPKPTPSQLNSRAVFYGTVPLVTCMTRDNRRSTRNTKKISASFILTIRPRSLVPSLTSAGLTRVCGEQLVGPLTMKKPPKAKGGILGYVTSATGTHAIQGTQWQIEG